MRTLGYFVALAMLAAGCRSLPFTRHSLVCAVVPFEYGTNAVLQIEEELKEPGGYDLFLVLDSNGFPRDEHGRWPMMLPTRLHVLVWTNGQPALDQELMKLYFTGSGKDHVAYGLTGFGTIGHTVAKCEVHDLSDGRIRARGSLKLRQTFAK